MKNLFNFFMIITLIVLILSCGQKNNTNFNNQNTDQVEFITIEPTVYNIEGENIVLRTGPGENYDKLINKTATDALGEINYMEVDYTVNVIIEETTENWSKIKVVEPKWLTNSHVGWIPTKNIVLDKKSENLELEKLDQTPFEILKTEHNPAVENFHVLIKFPKINEDKIFNFEKIFVLNIVKETVI